jgi:hypothetical protein
LPRVFAHHRIGLAHAPVGFREPPDDPIKTMAGFNGEFGNSFLERYLVRGQDM